MTTLKKLLPYQSAFLQRKNRDEILLKKREHYWKNRERLLIQMRNNYRKRKEKNVACVSAEGVNE